MVFIKSIFIVLFVVSIGEANEIPVGHQCSKALSLTHQQLSGPKSQDASLPKSASIVSSSYKAPQAHDLINQSEVDRLFKDLEERKETVKKEAYAFLLKNIYDGHISFEEFVLVLKQSIIEFVELNKSIVNSNKYLVFNPQKEGYRLNKKSNSWVANIAASTALETGFNQQSIIFDDPKSMSLFALQHGIKDIVLFDDGAYSGTQLVREYIPIIKKAFRSVGKEVNIHIIVPYASETAIKRFKRASFAGLFSNKKVSFYYKETFPSFKKIINTSVNSGELSDNAARYLTKKYITSKHVLSFQHKLADAFSIVTDKVGLSVFNYIREESDGRDYVIKKSYDIVNDIKPPYKLEY